jgi:hypothetical protein
MKRMPIEDLLRWAYRDELPKDDAPSHFDMPGYGGAWGGIERYGELMTLVDEPVNCWGVVPNFLAGGRPHPDAVAIGKAVMDLDALALGIPEDWDPLADLGDLGALGAAAIVQALDRATALDRDGRTRLLKAKPSHLVRRCAILAPPEWRGDVPEVKLVTGANGKARWFRRIVLQGDAGGYECEVDGYNERRKRQYDDAYQKSYLDPDPTDVAEARAEYEVWHAALDLLVLDLYGLLAAHEALPTNHPARPWETGEAKQARILPDLRKKVRESAQAVKPRRRSKVTTSA